MVVLEAVQINSHPPAGQLSKGTRERRQAEAEPPPLWPPRISAPHAILLEPGAEPRCCPLKVRKLKLLSHWGRGRSERNSSDWVGSSPPFSVQPGLFLPPRAQPPATHPLQGPVSNHIQGTEGEDNHTFSFPS